MNENVKKRYMSKKNTVTKTNKVEKSKEKNERNGLHTDTNTQFLTSTAKCESKKIKQIRNVK